MMKRISLFDKLAQTKRDFCEWFHVRRNRKTLPARIAAMRAKERIKVLFVLWDLPMWKTEPLYKAMLEHPRFEPVLGLALSLEDAPSVSIDKYDILRSALNEKGYEYRDLTYAIMNDIDADLIFYEKPYEDLIDHRLCFKCHPNKLICHSHYAFNSTNQLWGYTTPLQTYSAFYFAENKYIKHFAEAILPDRAKTFKNTGLPFMDDLMKPKECFQNQWDSSSKGKKRIIWAPHHSIPTQTSYLFYSCFLDVCDIMIELAEKYKDSVYFAFKPHPMLKSKLVAEWGEERVSAYYEKWATMENAQYECGQYMGLFKYSDAMIHDCSSFSIEYHYTLNPVMYLVNGRSHEENLNDFAKAAYNCHYFGHKREEIEQFIQNVIAGIDPMKEQRRKYFEENLLPPNGKTACENIIDAILGQNGYE